MTTLALPPRIRLRYEKVGRVRFTSQRDLARIVERAMRRLQLPLAESQGFSPRPLLSFGLALPTGCASLAEYLDLRLQDGVATATTTVHDHGLPDDGSLGALAAALTARLPAGVAVTAAAALEGSEPSLQEAVTSCDWKLEVLGVSPAEMVGRVGRLVDSDAVVVVRERKGRDVTDDIRPNVLSLRAAQVAVRAIDGVGEVAGIDVTLSTRPRGVRPAELCRALGDDVALVGACRTHQWIENEDRSIRAEPLSIEGAGARRTAGCTEVQAR